MNKQKIRLFLMILAAFGLGISVILMRIMTQSMAMPPYQIGIWRFVLSGSLIWLISIFQKGKQKFTNNRHLWLIGLGAIFSVSGYTALFALNRMPSSLYIIILYIYPSLVVLYAKARKHPVPSLFWLALPMSFIGLVLTAYHPGEALVIDLTGLIFTLINAGAMALYLILSEKGFRGVDDRFSGTSWVITGAMLVSLVLIPIFGLSLPNSGREWGILLIYSIFGTLMPVLSMNIGLQLLGAARGSVIITVQPVITVLMAVIFLDEVLTGQQWIGGLLVVIAVVVLQLSQDRKSQGIQVNNSVPDLE
jgi:drug/metabolite transporter (DMT)-like permease